MRCGLTTQLCCAVLFGVDVACKRSLREITGREHNPMWLRKLNDSPCINNVWNKSGGEVGVAAASVDVMFDG